MVFWALKRACPDAVPPQALAALQNRFRLDLKRNLVYAKELFRLLDLFDSAGIQAIPFKGPVLAWSLYETPGLRFVSDLDLLVPQRDISLAIDLLTSTGYRPFGPSIALRFLLDCGQSIFRRPDGGFAVDLHWRLVAAHFSSLDEAEIRGRLAPVDIAGRRTTTFCPEDLFAFLCAHGAIHGWDSLLNVCDLARLVDACPLDWDAVLSRAARRCMSRFVSLGLCLTQDLLGSSLPPEIARHIRADPRVVALAASTCKRLRDGGEGGAQEQFRFKLQLLEGSGRKLRFLWYGLRFGSLKFLADAFHLRSISAAP